VAVLIVSPMRKTLTITCAAVVIACNLAVAAYLALFLFLSCDMIQNNQARYWSSYDWVCAAFTRAAYSLVYAAAFGGIAAVVNRFTLGRLLPQRRGLPWLVSATDALTIALGGIIGSMIFMVEKPWM
jgi:hypothetical protein